VAVIVLVCMPKVTLHAELLEKVMVPAAADAALALIARVLAAGYVTVTWAVTVEPFMPNANWLPFEKTMVPADCEEPAALNAGRAVAAEAVMVLPANPKLTLLELASDRVPDEIVEAPAANEMLAESDREAVTVDPAMPNEKLLLLEKTMVPEDCEEPAALIAGSAREAVMVLPIIPHWTLFALPKERVPELMDEAPAENHCTRSEPANWRVAAWDEFQSDGRTNDG
jgi:hypothetical protein